MPEDVSAILVIGGSFLVIICVFFGMIVKPIAKDYREKKEEAAERKITKEMVF